jgi:hypothetical protein
MIDDRFENLLEDFLGGWRKTCFSNEHLLASLLASLLHCFVRGMLAYIWVVAVTRLEMFWLLGEDCKSGLLEM